MHEGIEVNPTLSIVIPAYNEEENVPLLHEAIAKVIDPASIATEIIFVDDGSKDGTWAAIEKRVAIDPRVRGLKLKNNCGETAACDAGLRNRAGTYVMTMDADLQNDPQDIPKFLEALAKGYDCVCGTRSNRAARATTSSVSHQAESPTRCAINCLRSKSRMPAAPIARSNGNVSRS